MCVHMYVHVYVRTYVCMRALVHVPHFVLFAHGGAYCARWGALGFPSYPIRRGRDRGQGVRPPPPGAAGRKAHPGAGRWRVRGRGGPDHASNMMDHALTMVEFWIR